MELKSGISRLFRSKGISLVLVTVVIAALFWALNHSYLTPDSLRGIALAASLSGTLAVGMGCLLISGHVDLAAGAEGMMGGVLLAIFIRAGVSWPLAIVITLAAGAVFGLINAFFVNGLGFMAFITTIGMSSVYRGVGYVITKSDNVPIGVENAGFYKIGSAVVLGIPVPFIIMIVLLAVYGLMLTNTRFGRSIYMCGGNRNAARLAGIDPKKITTILFVNSGVLAALGGIVTASRMHFGGPGSVIGAEMDAITAAVLGGIAFTGGSGGMLGCFLGLILINSFKSGLTAVGLPAYYQTFAQGVLLLLALSLDYFNEKSRQKALKAKAE
jgi:ribose transport system permease protein